MLTLEEIKKRLLRPEINLAAIASDSGIKYHILRAVLYGNNPRYVNIKRISDYLENKGD